MKKGAIILGIIISSYVINFGVVNFVASQFEVDTPVAQKGVLDLTNWDFSNGGIVPLDGEWEFFPDQLLDVNDFMEDMSHNLSPVYVQVPANWTTYDIDGQSMSPYGKATYRLKISIDEENQVFGIKSSSIHMSNRIFINEEVVASSGDPGEEDVYIPTNRPYVVYFTLNKGFNEIIIQVANYDYLVGGGIINSINFGEQQHISYFRDIVMMHDWVQTCVFIIMGLYFLGIYSQRKKDLFFLFFSIYCLLAGLFTAVHGEKIWYMIFPDTSYNTFLRLQLNTGMIGCISFYLYIYNAFKDVASKRVVWTAVIIGSIMVLYYIFFPNFVPLWMHIPIAIFIVFAHVFATYVLISAASKKMEGSFYMIFGAIAMSGYVLKYIMAIYDILYENVLLSIFPIEPFVFLLMFSLLMSLRFSNAFKKNEQLSQELLIVDKVKDEFLATTSHELKTPLHGIINISSFLLDEKNVESSVKQKENLPLIHDTSMKLFNLVNDLIDVTRLKNGEFRLQLTKVDLKVSTQIVFDILAFEIRGKQIELKNEIDEVSIVIADENRIRQILYNLIQNAIKHTEKGQINVSSKLMDDKIYFYVEDTGIGIIEKKQEEIFGYFEQIDQWSPQNGYQSMGLGLYISRQLIEKMNGEIWVDWSEVGIGTRFGFVLPKADCPEQRVEGILHQQVSIPLNKVVSSQHDFDILNGHEHTILIVDDELSNIQILLNVLTKHKYNVITAFSAKEALRKLEKFKQIDLVILDVMMPEMSGIDLCEKIRKTHSLLELPVLFATVKDLPEDIELGFKAGANDYITKPFDAKTILARIQTLLSMKTSIEEAFQNEMAFLQSQIKPHFLYNAISIIIVFCYTDGQKAAHLLSMLSQYLRIIFNTDHTTTLVSLEKELKLVEAYVEIEKARFDRFHFHVDIDKGLEKLLIPPLCIQPFVENAIRHGLFEKDEAGQVTLTIRDHGRYISIVIEDDGVGIPGEILKQLENGQVKYSGIGMTNIKKRLESIKGSNIEVKSTLEEGTIVKINLPKQKMDKIRLASTTVR
ncbi:ATP-binding protein [Chengkuizengella sediminis]|uniref:hybrid sensor histidine kinase/response regulator n=1 Tax=Chengkuizengella sediminis TaxID=1885917 RepID=UPI0013898934|nr:ATP-binding protein [Chengkuizengella sediminis]NDI35197.1 response regulator [Chengkuizengella sediminis]